MRSMMMKITILVSCLVLAVLPCYSAPAKNNKEAFGAKPLKIYFTESSPPLAQVTGTSADNTTYTKYRWGVINVEFWTQNGGYIDDVDMDVEVALLNGQVNGVEQVVLFKGKIEYWTVELDGKKHFVTALIPGKIFSRYVGIAGQTPARANVYIAIKFSSKGQLLAEGYYVNRGNMNESDIKKWFSAIKGASNYNVFEVPNSVMARRDTPWGMIEVDKYEFEKKSK